MTKLVKGDTLKYHFWSKKSNFRKMQLVDNQDSQTNYTGIFNFLFKEKEGQSVNNHKTKI